MQVMITIGAVLICFIAIFAGVTVAATVNGFSGFMVFLIIVLGNFLFMGTTGMIAEGVGYLETIAYEMKNGNRTIYSQPMYSQPMQQMNATTGISNQTGKSILEAGASDKAGWCCSKCGERNNTGNAFCKYCGTHR